MWLLIIPYLIIGQWFNARRSDAFELAREQGMGFILELFIRLAILLFWPVRALILLWRFA